MERPIRILCVDDRDSLLEALRMRLDLEPDFICEHSATSANDLYDAVERADADAVLLDIEMPDSEPFEEIIRLRERRPQTRVIMLSAYVREGYLDAAVQAGAWGYLSKDDSPDSVVDAVRRVVRTGEFVLGPAVSAQVRLTRGPKGAE